MNKTSMPKISIIIPVFNVELNLKECLNSVINQTLNEIEIICINDGSTDDSLDILREFQEKDSRIILINQVNEGVSAARNNGLEVAKGEYIQFVDGDDFISLDCCEKIYRKAKACESEILLFGANWYFDDEYIKKSWTKELLENSENIDINTTTSTEFSKIVAFIWINSIKEKFWKIFYLLKS